MWSKTLWRALRRPSVKGTELECSKEKSQAIENEEYLAIDSCFQVAQKLFQGQALTSKQLVTKEGVDFHTRNATSGLFAQQGCSTLTNH